MLMRAGTRAFALTIFYVIALVAMPQRLDAQVPNIPPPGQAQAGAAQESAPAGVPVLKMETVIVPVRVVVRDNNGKVVTNLREENFKLTQDGKAQQIISFSPFTPSGAGDAAS